MARKLKANITTRRLALGSLGLLCASYAFAQAKPQPIASAKATSTGTVAPAPTTATKVLTPTREVATTSLPAAILARANQHLAETAKDILAWQGAALAPKAQPLYRPDLTTVAYYNIGVTKGSAAAGYMILSTGEHDMPVAEWSEEATSPVAELNTRALKLRRVAAKYYRLDPLSFVAEDERGELAVSLGDLPSRVLSPQAASGKSIAANSTWSARKAAYATTFASGLNLVRSEAAKAWQHESATRSISISLNSCDPWRYHWAGDHEQRWYYQIGANEAPNTRGCASGCGATAWAMMFGWADFKAANNASPWQYSKDIYPANVVSGVDVGAPKYMDSGVRSMTWDISQHLKTKCMPGEQGMTLPEDMSLAQKYLDDRETAARAQTDFYKTTNLNPSWALRDKADDLIRGGRPVILALGWEHYVLAYGYRKKKCTPGFDDHDFKINEGWGLGHGRWTSANTWFVGWLNPAPNPNPPPSSSSSSAPTCPAGKRCCEPPRNGRCTCISNDRACP